MSAASRARPKPRRARRAGARAANATAERAIDILLAFTEERPVWTMAQIAARFRMPRTTAHRYMNSLRARALVAEEAGGYRLGPRILPLARIARSGMSILDVAAGPLATLNQKFGEAVTLYERVDHDLVALTRLECRHRVRLAYTRGQLLPWPATASSKALLAHAEPAEQAALLRLMEPVAYTRRTVSSRAALRRALERICRAGYAYSDQERDEGVRGVAAAVFVKGRARYCVSLSGPTFRLTDATIAKIAAAVKETAAAISEAAKRDEYP